MKPRNDDGLDWLREIRGKLAAKCGHDPKKMGDYFRDLEVKRQKRLRRDKPELVHKC